MKRFFILFLSCIFLLSCCSLPPENVVSGQVERYDVRTEIGTLDITIIQFELPDGRKYEAIRTSGETRSIQRIYDQNEQTAPKKEDSYSDWGW